MGWQWKNDIGEVKRLVCVGNGMVAAVGTRGTVRFNWCVACSGARVDEFDDLRVTMAVRRAYCMVEDLAKELPIGAIIPLPSEKRAKAWFTQNRGPRRDSRWFLESAVEEGFKPRFYLGEERNPYEMGTRACAFWDLEHVYLASWFCRVCGYKKLVEGIDSHDKEFLEKVPDWQTRVLVAWMGEDEFLNGNYEPLHEYVKAPPLL